MARQTIEQGEFSTLKEELQVEEHLQQVEEMKMALEGVNRQFRENQKSFKTNMEEMTSIIGNQQILHQEFQDLKKEILKFSKARDIGNWILRMVYFGLIIVVGINLGMLVGDFLK